MPVKVKNNTKKVFRDIHKNIEQFIYGVGSIGATLSMYYAPLEWGDLRGSQTFDTGYSEGKSFAKVSFGEGLDEPYAAILENKPDWAPRPPEKKRGPAWNPEARPHFLSYGFEGPEAKQQTEQLKRKLKV